MVFALSPKMRLIKASHINQSNCIFSLAVNVSAHEVEWNGCRIGLHKLYFCTKNKKAVGFYCSETIRFFQKADF